MVRTILKMIVAVLLLAANCVAVEDGHGWAVVYVRSEVNPGVSYAINCGSSNPGCNTVYRDVEDTIWFPSRALAMDFVNGLISKNDGSWYGSVVLSDSAKSYINGSRTNPSHPLPAERIIGIYECKKVSIALHKTGIHHESITETHDKEVDTMEWQ